MRINRTVVNYKSTKQKGTTQPLADITGEISTCVR
jgi:hypothetical protein